MKDLLEYLCSNQEKELEALVKKISEKFNPEQIYCFGYRRNSLIRYSCFTECDERDSVDCDLLVITESTLKNETEIQEFARECFTSGNITTINFSRKVVLASLAVGQNFINTIIKNGFLLFTKVDEPYGNEHIKERAVDINTARFYFERNFETAWSFIDAAADRMINEDYKLTVFMLHQALEFACRGSINLFLGFNGNKKNLETLFALVNNIAGHLPLFRQYEQNNKLVKQLLKCSERVKFDMNFVAEKDTIISLQSLTENLIETMDAYGKEHLNKLISN